MKFRKNIKRHGKGHLRVSIPYEIRKYIRIEKGDFIEWEADSKKQTLKGKFIKNDAKVIDIKKDILKDKKSINKTVGWFPKELRK